MPCPWPSGCKWARPAPRSSTPTKRRANKGWLPSICRPARSLILYVFYYEGSREHGKRTSRLQTAADNYERPVFRNEAFVPVPGWNAAESVKAGPVVPILYVGVPLVLAVWGV